MKVMQMLFFMSVLAICGESLRLQLEENKGPKGHESAHRKEILEKQYARYNNPAKYTGVKIMCTGWKKTGTSSLKVAYRRLGMLPTAMVNSCSSPDCMDKYASAQDAYGCCNHHLVEAMKKRYSESELKFVHLERRPEAWRKSVDLWLNRPNQKKMDGVSVKDRMKAQYSHLMGAKYGTSKFYDQYEEHNKFIRNLFMDQPHRLLILNLQDDDPLENMKKFCEFVGQPNHMACAETFPHAKDITSKKYGVSKGVTEGYKLKVNASDIDMAWDWIDADENEGDDFDEDLAMKEWPLE